MIVEPSNLRQLMIPNSSGCWKTLRCWLPARWNSWRSPPVKNQARLASERESIRNSLLAALSHDLRTPLTVLFGRSEILTLDLAAEGLNTASRPAKSRQHVLNTTVW